MSKNFIKKPATWFAKETLGNFLYDLLGLAWRSAILTALTSLVLRLYYATAVDVWLIAALFVVALVAFGLDRYWSNRKQRQQGQSDVSLTEESFGGDVIKVAHRQFFNERVLLDGHSYTNCIFTNPTFVYNGTGPIALQHNEIRGVIRFDTESRAVSIAWLLMQSFNLPMEVRDQDMNPVTNVQKVQGITPPTEAGGKTDQ